MPQACIIESKIVLTGKVKMTVVRIQYVCLFILSFSMIWPALNRLIGVCINGNLGFWDCSHLKLGFWDFTPVEIGILTKQL